MNSVATTPTGAPMVRRIKVTLGIAALGACAGAVAGGIVASIVVAIVSADASALIDWFPYVIGAEIGAPLGAVLLPVAAWTLMRQVSFGRAVAGTIAGALSGGLMGYFVGGELNALFTSLAGGVIGVGVAATLLRLRVRAAQPSIDTSEV